MTMHVVPVADLREHDVSQQCWCRPSQDDEADGVVYVHHSIDGREAFETGERLPS